jgi:putative oxidoreductase
MDCHCVPKKHSWYSWLCSWIQSPLLLVIRLIWGILFFMAGWGKLMNITMPIEFFESLGIPYPVFSAWLVALTETIGGGLLVIGFLARLAALPLIITMVTALLTAHLDGVLNMFHDFQGFMNEEPFYYLLASLIILAFGPGFFSLDAICYYSRKKKKKTEHEDKEEHPS